MQFCRLADKGWISTASQAIFQKADDQVSCGLSCFPPIFGINFVNNKLREL